MKFFLLSFIISFLLASCKDNGDHVVEKANSHLNEIYASNETNNEQEMGFTYLPAAVGSNQIIRHHYYTLSYNEKAEQADWVAYELKKEFISNSKFKRPYFIEDPKVITASADWRNYKRSGYDKGHLCPAGDMQFDKEAFNDTFYTSNISPQNHEFNAGIWNRLEQKVRYWAVRYQNVYVITGGIFKSSSRTIGKEKIIVPDYFYKILLRKNNGTYKMIAFLVPHQESKRPLYDFIVSVNRIEALSGIDFFPKLNDNLEASLEKNTNYSLWMDK
jgi:endonuclease G